MHRLRWSAIASADRDESSTIFFTMWYQMMRDLWRAWTSKGGDIPLGDYYVKLL